MCPTMVFVIIPKKQIVLLWVITPLIQNHHGILIIVNYLLGLTWNIWVLVLTVLVVKIMLLRETVLVGKLSTRCRGAGLCIDGVKYRISNACVVSHLQNQQCMCGQPPAELAMHVWSATCRISNACVVSQLQE